MQGPSPQRVAAVLGFLTLLLATAGTVAAAGDIEPGTVWKDTDGNVINCHGGGFVFRDGIYFWFGEHKVDRTGHAGVGCYSSTDLLRWKSRGVVLSAGGADGDLADGCVIERPKVLFNRKTSQFVMWFHLELAGQKYTAARAAVAVSATPAGPYKYLGSFRPDAGHWPVDFPDDRKKVPAGQEPKSADAPLRRDFAGGQMSRDQTLFLDDDGTAYQIASSEDNRTLHVSKLADDFLKSSGEYARVLGGEYNEAPAVFKHDGKYFLITSGTTGWAPNAARLAVADRPMGPWKRLGNPCVGTKDQVATTFASQAAVVLPVPGKPDAFIYVGDRWNAKDLPDSRYIWLPISFDDGRPKLRFSGRWSLSNFTK